MRETTSRRRFVQTASLLALVGCALPWGAALAQTPQKPKDDKKKKKKKRLPEPGDDPKFDCGKYWVAELGPSTSFSSSEPCLTIAEFRDFYGILMEKEKIYVRRERVDVETLRWVVLSAICTHLKCKIDYSPEDGHFVCPCHKSEFDLDGEVLRKPARKPLPDYSELLLREEGRLYLRREATRRSEPPPDPDNPEEQPQPVPPK